MYKIIIHNQQYSDYEVVNSNSFKVMSDIQHIQNGRGSAAAFVFKPIAANHPADMASASEALLVDGTVSLEFPLAMAACRCCGGMVPLEFPLAVAACWCCSAAVDNTP